MSRQLVGALFSCVSIFVAAQAFGQAVTFPERFLAEISVPTANTDAVSGLVYGNGDYGYFEVSALTVDAGSVSTKIIPPGYRSPLEIFLRKTDAQGASYLEAAGQRQFSFPLTPSELSPQPLETAANLTSGFFLSFRGALKDADGKATAYVFNRFAEVVWAYGLNKSTAIRLGSPLGDGKFVFVGAAGIVEVANFDGTVDASVRLLNSEGRPYPLDHDFIYNGGPEYTVMGYNPIDYPGAPGSELMPDRYCVGRLVRGNFTDSSPANLWDALADGPMLYGPGWVDNLPPATDIPGLKDFDHINSISMIPGKGYVVSIRNFDTLVFLDLSYRVVSTLGSVPGVTMSTTGRPYQFRAQHHATVLANDNILLFDNKGRNNTSRMMELRVDDTARSVTLVKEFKPRTPVIAPTMGSAFRLENGNTVGAFCNSVPGGQEDGPTPEADTGLRVIEFDPAGREVGRLYMPKEVSGDVYRAFPMETIGRETYLGKTLR